MDALSTRERLQALFAGEDARVATCETQGELLTFKSPVPSVIPPTAPKRTAIHTFSAHSRRRLVKYFHRIDWHHFTCPLFVTLTYPDDCAFPDLDQRNVHRAVFMRHMERITGRHVPAVWRIEWVPRKSGEHVGEYVPHWHLLFFRHRFIHYEEINLAWRKTIGHADYVRTEIKALYKDEPIRLYLAKYISKEAVSPSLVWDAYHNSLGRAWGMLRKDEIPTYPLKVYQSLTAAQRAMLMAFADENLPFADASREESFTLLGESAKLAAAWMEKIGLTGTTGDEYTTGSIGGTSAARDCASRPVEAADSFAPPTPTPLQEIQRRISKRDNLSAYLAIPCSILERDHPPSEVRP